MVVSFFDQETTMLQEEEENRNMDNSCPLIVPVGFKFNPTDEELVRCYLLNKVTGNLLPFCEDIVKDCDIYGDKEPWKIWEILGNQPFFNDDGFVYVFTRLKQRSPNSSTIQRRIGSNGGSWHGEDSGKTFKGSGGIKWTQKRFRYENKNCKSQDDCWLMQEYSLDQQTLIKIQNKDNNIVLCRIKKNEKKRKKREYEVMEAEIELKRFKNMDQSVLENQEKPHQVEEEFQDYWKSDGLIGDVDAGDFGACLSTADQINISDFSGETEEENIDLWMESLHQEFPKSNQNQVLLSFTGSY